MAGKIVVKNIADACEEYYKIFGANRNLFRVMPGLVDGLRPVNRRILYAMYLGKARNTMTKVTKIVGDTTGDFHPHGDASVEEVVGGMGCYAKNNILLIEGTGNFGNYKNLNASSGRYIEGRLSKYALKCFFEDFETTAVEMMDSYNGQEKEPMYLPARYPHVLVNPVLSGIGNGNYSCVAPYNFNELIDTVLLLMKDPKAKFELYPDVPTGADVVLNDGVRSICEEGKGSLTLKAHVEIDEINNVINITNIPLQITIDDIIRNIVQAKQNKGLFKEIINITDNSDDHHVDAKIYLNQSANPYKTLEMLYKKGVGMKKTIPVDLKLIDDFMDSRYTVRRVILEWLDFRRDCVRSSYNRKLVQAYDDQNINDILLFILDEKRLEETMTIVKSSANKSDLSAKLMKKYKMDSQQANVIAGKSVSAFTKDARESYKQKRADLKKQIKELEAIAEDESSIDRIIKEQMEEGKKLFGGPRRSRLVSDEEESVEDIPNTDHIVAISKDGYVKKVSLNDKVIGQVGSVANQCITMMANNREHILVFDSTGMLSRIPVSTIPNMKKKDSGVSIGRYFPVNGNIVSALLEPSEAEMRKRGKELYFTFLTKQGFVKRTLLSQFSNVNGSTVSIKLPKDDELVAVEFTSDATTKDMVIYTNYGNGIRRDINEFNILQANARGTRQMTLSENEFCVGFDKVNPDKKLMFYITSAGRVKLTDMKYFPTMKRKDEVLSLITLESNETLVGIRSVSKDDSIIAYRKHGEPVVIELTDIPVSTRIAKGEKVVKTPKGDYVLSFSVIVKK